MTIPQAETEEMTYGMIHTIKRFHESPAQIRCIVEPIGSGKTTGATWDVCYYRPCFLQRRYGIKAHLFGMTRYDFLESIPAFSYDSASWTKSASFDDVIMYWNPQNPGINKTDKIYMETKIKLNPGKRFFYSTYKFRRDIDEYLWNDLNLTYRDLLGYNGLFNRQLINLHYFMEIEKRITERHRELGYPY